MPSNADLLGRSSLLLALVSWLLLTGLMLFIEFGLRTVQNARHGPISLGIALIAYVALRSWSSVLAVRALRAREGRRKPAFVLGSLCAEALIWTVFLWRLLGV